MGSSPVSLVRICQRGLTILSQTVSRTGSLEHMLRICNKTIKIRSLLQGKEDYFPLIERSIDILGVVQCIRLIEPFICPDHQGTYLMQRVGLQKCMARGFLLGYSLLLNLRLAEKRKIIRLPQVTRITIGSCSLLRLATDTSYLFYRLFILSEGVRTGRLWQVTISSSKTFTVASTLILKMVNIQATPLVFALTSMSVLTDVCLLAKKEKWI